MTGLQSAFAGTAAAGLPKPEASAEKPPPDAGAAWFVCHTKPRCEKKFAALMRAERFEHYLPLVDSVRRYAQQTKRFTKPLFPGYVFARIPVDRKARVYQQDLLARAGQGGGAA